MATLLFEPRVKDTSTTTGTGDFTLANSAPTSFRTLNAALGTGTNFGYLIQLDGEWEEGVGTLSNSTTLVRTTVIRSSNANALVNFSAGTKTVFHTVPSSYIVSNISASVTDHAIARYDGTTGTYIQSSTATIDDTGNLALGSVNLTLTGSIASTGARVTKGWFTDLEVTNAITGSIANIAGGAGGSIPYQSAVNTTVLLANGSLGQVLTSAGGTSAPTWEEPDGVPTPYAETPTGAVNSSNVAYTLSQTPASGSGTIVILDGTVQYSGIDYTVAGTTITFTTAPTTGSTIFAYYNVYSGGGSAAWGGITGTLSAQTDLQTALNAKKGRTVVVTSGGFTAGNTAGIDYVYLIAAAHNATMPTASGNTSRYTFKNNHSAAITITRDGADTVEGATTLTLGVAESVDLISNGSSAWYVI